MFIQYGTSLKNLTLLLFDLLVTVKDETSQVLKQTSTKHILYKIVVYVIIITSFINIFWTALRTSSSNGGMRLDYINV